MFNSAIIDASVQFPLDLGATKPNGPTKAFRALFALLKSQAEKYCSLICCERKTLLFRWKSTADKSSEQGPVSEGFLLSSYSFWLISLWHFPCFQNYNNSNGLVKAWKLRDTVIDRWCYKVSINLCFKKAVQFFQEGSTVHVAVQLIMKLKQ
jgi:hypothetical protein